MSKSLRFAALSFLAIIVAAVAVQAQKPGAPPIDRAVHWSSLDADIYLVQKNSGGFLLTVASQKEFIVTYHTRINSLEPVDKVLTPIQSANGVKQYVFDHNFTKMTIWMGLEFSFDGKPVPELTRTFLNDIGEVVPNGYFPFGAKPKP